MPFSANDTHAFAAAFPLSNYPAPRHVLLLLMLLMMMMPPTPGLTKRATSDPHAGADDRRVEDLAWGGKINETPHTTQTAHVMAR